MKIAFVWYWDKASQILPDWRDGLRAAMEELGKEHTVDWYLDEKLPEDTYDAYLIWGDSNCPALHKLALYKGKKGIFLTTNPTSPDNLRHLDAVFCESSVVLEEARRAGLRAIKAFGTDTEFFTLDEAVEKDIDFFYPATFSPWKRQHTIANLGPKLLCVGTVQPDGIKELEACKQNGVKTVEAYLPVEDVRDFFRRTKNMIIPAIHGSERTVLEAMSMNILPVVASENRKARSYLDEYRNSPFKSPRDFVIHNYSPQVYVKQILRGIT